MGRVRRYCFTSVRVETDYASADMGNRPLFMLLVAGTILFSLLLPGRAHGVNHLKDTLLMSRFLKG